jgi:hypothetical protein
MAEVFRGKYAALSKQAIGGYAFHGVTALLALWMFMKAVG